MRLLLLAAALFLAAPSAHAADGVVVENAWARATPAGHPNGAVYFTLRNVGKAQDTLTGATSAIAAKAELHESKRVGTMMRMEALGPLALAPGDAVEFKPGGKHVMLLGLKAPLKAGDKFTLTLDFKTAGAQDVTVEIRDIAAPGHGYGPMH